MPGFPILGDQWGRQIGPLGPLGDMSGGQRVNPTGQEFPGDWGADLSDLIPRMGGHLGMPTTSGQQTFGPQSNFIQFILSQLVHPSSPPQMGGQGIPGAPVGQGMNPGIPQSMPGLSQIFGPSSPMPQIPMGGSPMGGAPDLMNFLKFIFSQQQPSSPPQMGGPGPNGVT